ncbi:phage tail assembly chaperone [Pseudovibrio exalbescens]|uniref:phage tail assembly chaperone n=1 Tax=Pseudovibrio exalbescens TaxID=197461 RepID=UPI0011AEE7F7|nr:phage tail assembly chaperone [Pseudovibrio exalbescens]
MTRPFPWQEAMRLAFSHLGWCPRTFWQATPRELAAGLATPQNASPFLQQDLVQLMGRYPDKKGDH